MAVVRGVGIALPVGQRVVLAVVGDPLGDGALAGHGPRDCPEGRHEPRGLEGAMREQPVEADGDAQPAEHVHGREHHEVDRAESEVLADGADVGRMLKHRRPGLPVLLSSDGLVAPNEMSGAIDRVIAKDPLPYSELAELT